MDLALIKKLIETHEKVEELTTLLHTKGLRCSGLSDATDSLRFLIERLAKED
jgi:hypothetical protein